ncbi:unnamed protein product [Rhizophagus irregularis]|nr:unnamed protein product [Rhizophagus irregularis]
MVSFQNDIKCKNCDEIYTNIKHKWCKPCQINKVNSFKNNVSNYTSSGNEKINYFIQETQLKFERYDDIIIEWIPYSQFNNIKEINKSNFSAVYSAIWKDGPLQHDEHYEELRRVSNKQVILKCLYNFQNIINDLLYEAKLYSIERKQKYDYLKIYGISQNPDTKDYILVFNDGYCLNCGEIYTDEDNKWCKPCQLNNLKNHFDNWTSENEKIDEFIQKMQLKIKYHNDIIIEWIPYNQLHDIKEISKNDFTAVYLAIWKDGPLQYNKNYGELKREHGKEIAIKYFYNFNSQNINDFLFEIKSYSIEINNYYNNILNIYGISQNPDTKDYIVVLNNGYCENCSVIYTKIYYKWCKSCLLNNLKINFTSWTSGNEKIDELIQEMQLKINKWNDIIVEWIPYNQFNDIKEISRNDFTVLYSAIWKDGPLQHNNDERNGELKRIRDKGVALKCLCNSQGLINNEFLSEIKSYSIEIAKDDNIPGIIHGITQKRDENNLNIYGISQDPNTKDYIVVLNNGYCENCGEIYTNVKKKWCKTCQLNNFKKYFSYGTSTNEKIDNFIQEMQLKINKWDDIIVEWIPYNQLNNIKEMGNIGYTTIYSAIWKDGPLQIDKHYGILKRISDKKITLRYLHNSRNITDNFLNEVVKEFFIEKGRSPNIFGISQNPGTKDYIIVLNNNYCENCNKIYTHKSYKWCKQCQLNNLRKCFINWTSGNEKIDDFIQEIQLKIKEYDDIIFEWIPYNQFNDIKKISKNDTFAIYSAIWIRGPLKYNRFYNKLLRHSHFKKVSLKYFYNLQNIIDEFKSYSINTFNGVQKIYGISQNSDTKDYIIIFQDGRCENCGEIRTGNYKWCKPCQINNLKQNFVNWTSKNKEIDELIQKMQLKIDKHNNITEWISYNQFYNIKKISEDSLTIIYSAIWMEGPLHYNKNYEELIRIPNEKVALKYLCNSQDINNDFLNEIRKYSNSNDKETLNLYGISQNPDTKDYVIVIQNGYCKNCSKIYTSIKKKWCKPCQINNLKQNFTNWTSGNKEIDNLIQEMQLKINKYNDIIVEWIPYNQFNNIKEIGKGGFAIVYSAIWKDGPLYYDDKYYKELKRIPNKKVALKCLNNSQNINNEFLNEIKEYSISYNDRILSLYGISQNPDTKDYVMVLNYADGGTINNFIYINIDWYWFERLWVLNNIIEGNSASDVYISDMGLCGEVGNIDGNKIYGVMPYVAPEVLKGKPYTQAADIYSFGMIMYFVATKRQPFANYAHDNILALNICNGNRPKINENEAPKCYIDLMKRCWDSNPNNRPSAIEVGEFIRLFRSRKNEEIEKQFIEAEEYRKTNLLSVENIQSTTHHPQAYYTSRLLNSYTKDLSKYDNINNNSVEIVDFTMISAEDENMYK